ncbi:hypothetical protein KY289_027077 [Solanum tuberosum]|nr:hypothetical protein KY289_027077 [Solanum tuberosum]
MVIEHSSHGIRARGYRSWKRSVLRVLSVKNKLGFINGDCKRPDRGTSRFRQWGRCDDMELEDRYDQTNGAKLMKKKREIKPNAQVFMESKSLNASSSGKKVMESIAFNTNGSAEASTSRSMRANYSSTGDTNPNF